MSARVSDLERLPDWPLMMSAEQAAAYVGLSRPSFQKAVDDAIFPEPVRLGRRALWHRQSLDLFAARLAGLPSGTSGTDAAIPAEEWEKWRQSL